MLTSNNNRYGMHLTPEETQNSELLRNLAVQQQLQMQQAQLYAHGWHDPRSLQNVVQPDKFPLHAADAEFKPHKQIVLPKIKAYHVLFAFSLLLIIIPIVYEISILF